MEEQGIESCNPDVSYSSAGFSKEACWSAWEKVGAAPCMQKCLLDPKVSKSLGDGDDEYYNLIQVANDHAVHALNKMGYAGHLLGVKIEDDREVAVPLTKPFGEHFLSYC